MATSIVSVMTGIPVRRDVAMTGEITLRGRVLPIGGLKEKLLAALRAGITTVFIPKDNEKDLADIAESVKKNLKIIAVSHVDEVISQALARRPGADRVGRACRSRSWSPQRSLQPPSRTDWGLLGGDAHRPLAPPGSPSCKGVTARVGCPADRARFEGQTALRYACNGLVCLDAQGGSVPRPALTVSCPGR